MSVNVGRGFAANAEAIKLIVICVEGTKIMNFVVLVKSYGLWADN